MCVFIYTCAYEYLDVYAMTMSLNTCMYGGMYE